MCFDRLYVGDPILVTMGLRGISGLWIWGAHPASIGLYSFAQLSGYKFFLFQQSDFSQNFSLAGWSGVFLHVSIDIVIE